MQVTGVAIVSEVCTYTGRVTDEATHLEVSMHSGVTECKIDHVLGMVLGGLEIVHDGADRVVRALRLFADTNRSSYTRVERWRKKESS